jgi:hypothetical protein
MINPVDILNSIQGLCETYFLIPEKDKEWKGAIRSTILVACEFANDYMDAVEFGDDDGGGDDDGEPMPVASVVPFAKAVGSDVP